MENKQQKINNTFQIIKNMWPQHNPRLQIVGESVDISITRDLCGYIKPQYNCYNLEDNHTVIINGISFSVLINPSTVNLFTYI
jgi:hypothetical protein